MIEFFLWQRNHFLFHDDWRFSGASFLFAPRTQMKSNSANAVSTSREAPAYVKAKAAPGEPELEKIRDACKAARNLQLEISDAENALKEKRASLNDLERKVLPDLFSVAGITSLTLEANGNMPAYEAERSPYYRANIAANWPDEKRQEAFDWLEKNGGGDLIKAEIIITLPRKSEKLRKSVLAALKKLKLPDVEVDLAVPWSSLTSFVRECYEKRKIKPPLDKLGADVGEIVRLKVQKEE
jgi:hypothetical protein